MNLIPRSGQFRTLLPVALCLASLASAPAFAADGTAASADARARAVLAQMTLDQKIQLVHGAGYGVSPIGGAGWIPGIPALGIPSLPIADSAGGVNVAGTNATALPAPVALAASWDTGLAWRYGQLIGTELRTLGFAEGLGGGIDLAREPRNGRTFEYMGEDPLLSGRMLAHRIRGTQSTQVIATAKHYAMNDQETNRFTSNSVIDERTMRELHLLGFEVAVKEGQVGNVMCAYNLVNGEKSCQNHHLLTDILKDDWGFPGIVQSDWFLAVTDTVAAATAGLDEEEAGSQNDYTGSPPIPLPTYFNQKLKAAVLAGQVPQSRLDDMVLRKLRTLFRIGLMDHPPVAGGTIDRTAGNAFAHDAAAQSMVLLKNSPHPGDRLAPLPLDARKASRIVVIGGNADQGVISGGGSGSVPAADGNAVTCLDPNGNSGLLSTCAIWYKSAPLAAIQAAAPHASVTFVDGHDAAAAAAAAASADVAIVFATQWESEGVDLGSLSLPDPVTDLANEAYDQNALIAAVAAQARRTVVVLETGSVVTMPWLSQVDTVLEAWYPGVQGGPAIADVLFGTVNPSGHTPLSFPVSEADLPQKSISATDLDVVYAEGLQIGYRWYQGQKIAPLFPFGHGLSYTRFDYSGLRVQPLGEEGDGGFDVSFNLHNAGNRDGAEVPQVYLQLPAYTGEPPLRLAGWDKVRLRAGESRRVTVHIDAASAAHPLSFWNSVHNDWELAQGPFVVAVGASSGDLRLQKAVTVGDD